MTEEIKILDACCGSRMFWFDKNESHTTFMDIRGVISWSWFYVFLPAIADLVISILILMVVKMIWNK